MIFLPIYSIALILLCHLPNEIATSFEQNARHNVSVGVWVRMLFFSGNICYCDYVNAFSAIWTFLYFYFTLIFFLYCCCSVRFGCREWVNVLVSVGIFISFFFFETKLNVRSIWNITKIPTTTTWTNERKKGARDGVQ